MGFRVRREEPGALEFPARFLYIAGNYSWIILLVRQIRGEVVRVHFSPAGVGTTVEITGRAGRGIRRMISVLGDNDHWPANLDDDDWLPTPTDHWRAQNYLLSEHIEKIVSAYHAFADIPGYAAIITHDELRANDVNLNIRRYADNAPPPEPQDVRAHLVGGIPKREVADKAALGRWTSASKRCSGPGCRTRGRSLCARTGWESAQVFANRPRRPFETRAEHIDIPRLGEVDDC